MKKTRIIASLLALIIFCSLCPTALAVSDFTLDAAAGILVHPDTGMVLFEQNADVQRYPASLTKVTTALVLIEAIENEEIGLDDMVTAQEGFDFDLAEDGSSQYIQLGEEMSLKDLLYCILVASANEACNIAAQYCSGSIDAFVDEMNALATSLGCTGTHYVNTHGLHDDNHYTTARDMSIIALEAIKHPLFVEITGAASYITAATNKTDPRTLHNTNSLITDTYNNYYTYEYCRGGKTGHTSKAGNCLMSYAEKDGVQLLSVVMGAEVEQIDENRTGSYSFSETKRLFEWGYSNYGNQTVVSVDDMVAEAKVTGGESADFVVLHPANDISFFLPYDFDFSTIEQVVRLSSVDGVPAPVKEGDCLGSLDLYQNEGYLGSVDLIALNSVAAKGESEPATEGEAAAAEPAKKAFGWIKVLLIVIILLVILYIVLLIVNARRRRNYRRRREAAKRIKK